jgi:hypothetical protein
MTWAPRSRSPALKRDIAKQVMNPNFVGGKARNRGKPCMSVSGGIQHRKEPLPGLTPCPQHPRYP